MASVSVKLISLVVLCMVVAMPMATQAITCGQVAGSLSSCLGYLRRGGVPTPPCCSGVRSLNSAANNTPARQQVCQCLKSFAGGLNYGFASNLPGKCGLSLPYKISPTTNCNSIR